MQGPPSALDLITVIIAAYAALVSTALTALAIYRDRHRLKVRIAWITHPTPGITIKCVNTGRRPVGVEQVMFVSELKWKPDWRRLRDERRNIGWKGTEHPNPPSPVTELPAHLEIAKEAVLHYVVDTQFMKAVGIQIFDSFGKTHGYRFKTSDRVGLRLTLDRQTPAKAFSPAELRNLARSQKGDKDAKLQEYLLAVADDAEKRGIKVMIRSRSTGWRGRGTMVQAVPVAEGSEGEVQASADPPGNVPSVSRPPFPFVPIGILFLLMAASLALLIWGP